MYFPPSNFIKADDIKGIKDKTVLSIGSGSADLETFLTLYGLPVKNMTTSDISTKFKPKRSPHKTFDCWQQWPGFNSKFDLILFPNSIFGDAKRLDERISKKDGKGYGEIITRLYYDLFKPALANLKPGGSIRAQTLLRGLCVDHGLFAQFAADGYVIESKDLSNSIPAEHTGIRIDLKNK